MSNQQFRDPRSVTGSLARRDVQIRRQQRRIKQRDLVATSDLSQAPRLEVARIFERWEKREAARARRRHKLSVALIVTGLLLWLVVLLGALYIVSVEAELYFTHFFR